jgi:hypothetical protein
MMKIRLAPACAGDTGLSARPESASGRLMVASSENLHRSGPGHAQEIRGPGRTRTCDNTVMSGQPRGKNLRDPECY